MASVRRLPDRVSDYEHGVPFHLLGVLDLAACSRLMSELIF